MRSVQLIPPQPPSRSVIISKKSEPRPAGAINPKNNPKPKPSSPLPSQLVLSVSPSASALNRDPCAHVTPHPHSLLHPHSVRSLLRPNLIASAFPRASQLIQPCHIPIKGLVRENDFGARLVSQFDGDERSTDDAG